MCNNFYNSAIYKDTAEYFEYNPVNEELSGYQQSVFPKYKTLICLPERKPAVMSWGFQHPSLNRVVNNARTDKLHTSFWGYDFKHHRCLFPLTGFVEYNATKHKFLVTLPDSPIFACAGLYNDKGECTLLMGEANEFVGKIHDRMPIIIHKKNFDDWLIKGGRDLLVPYTGEMAATCLAEPKPKPEKKPKPKPVASNQPELF